MEIDSRDNRSNERASSSRRKVRDDDDLDLGRSSKRKSRRKRLKDFPEGVESHGFGGKGQRVRVGDEL